MENKNFIKNSKIAASGLLILSIVSLIYHIISKEVSKADSIMANITSIILIIWILTLINLIKTLKEQNDK